MTKEHQMKAWTVWDGEPGCDDLTALVFAETASKAKAVAFMLEEFGYVASFTNLRSRRAKELDYLYKGEDVADWFDEDTRIELVKNHGWSCGWRDTYCDECPAKEWCGLWT